MERFERVVSMKVLKLRSQETVTGKKEFVLVGTSFVCGEGIQCKGKVTTPTYHTHSPTFSVLIEQIRIFDVVEVIPEPGKPLTKNRLKVRCRVICDDIIMTSWCYHAVSLRRGAEGLYLRSSRSGWTHRGVYGPEGVFPVVSVPNYRFSSQRHVWARG